MPARALPVLAAVLALAALSAACDSDGASDTPAPGTTATPQATVTAVVSPTADRLADCSPNLEAALGELTWQDILPADIPTPEGWRVEEDPGSGPFLAVFEGDQRVSSLELLQFPLEADFDPDQGLQALLGWVEPFYESIREDRLAGYGPDYVFEPFDAKAAPFGALCGLRYGFSATDPSGAIAERFIGHATFDGSNLYLITAFYDAATAAEGIGFQDEASVRAFEGSLDELIAALRVP